MLKMFGSRPPTALDSTRGGYLTTSRDLPISPFTATPPTSPTARPCMNSSAVPMQTSSPWNIAVYGHSEGKPSEAGVYRDADAAYEYLVNTKGIDRKAIISFGQSLGTVVATHLAVHRQVVAVVLEAPFPSASRVASRFFWFLPGLSLVTHGQQHASVANGNTHAPILIVHCIEDPVIPFEFGQEVYAAALPPKSFLQINGSCHEGSSLIAPTQYQTALQGFLSGL